MTVLVTGGAGFIGSNFVREWIRQSDEPVINLDRLTYAGSPDNLSGLPGRQHLLVQGDIGDRQLVWSLLNEHRPRAIINFAAESHVDRSIVGPAAFIQTNLVGTFELLEAARSFWDQHFGKSDGFRFIHVSTDEVYGSLSPDEPAVRENHPYAPSSPYSASKAGSDHLVRAYRHTYGLPTLVTNCTNNYGPRQHPEKLIPLTISNALAGRPIPVYGNGQNIRDWLYVTDHCAAIRLVLEHGRIGETYNVSGGTQERNIDVVRTICALLDEISPRKDGSSYSDLISFVTDRPGHDFRYALDASKIMAELGWSPAETFPSGIRKTIEWYVANRDWVERRLGSSRPGAGA
jgi:dTDP-glucose 4,6-dehydratase